MVPILLLVTIAPILPLLFSLFFDDVYHIVYIILCFFLPFFMLLYIFGILSFYWGGFLVSWGDNLWGIDVRLPLLVDKVYLKVLLRRWMVSFIFLSIVSLVLLRILIGIFIERCNGWSHHHWVSNAWVEILWKSFIVYLVDNWVLRSPTDLLVTHLPLTIEWLMLAGLRVQVAVSLIIQSWIINETFLVDHLLVI